MAAPGLGQYAHAASVAGPDAYGVQLQSYSPLTGPSTSPSASSHFHPAPPQPGSGPSNAGFHHEPDQSQLEWGSHLQHHSVANANHGGWLNALPETGESSSSAEGASTVAYPPPRVLNPHNALHSLPAVQYNWQPQPRPYTPYQLPPALPHGSSASHLAAQYGGYRAAAEYTPYAPPASHAPLTYQPLLQNLPSLLAHAPPPPPPHDQGLPPIYHSAQVSNPSLPSLPLSYPGLSSYARPDSLSTTNATRDGSAAVSTPSSTGSVAPEEPPALVEPHSPNGRRDGQYVAGSSIELPAHHSVPPLIPALDHINSADVAPGRALAIPLELDSGALSGTKASGGLADSKLGAPLAKRKKEPKDLASRKYACNECDQRFARPSALATHVLTHTKEKPFVCCTCNRGFAVMSNLRRHCRVRSHALAPEQESSARTRPPLVSSSSGSSGGPTGFLPDPGPPPLRPLAPAPPGLQTARY